MLATWRAIPTGSLPLTVSLCWSAPPPRQSQPEVDRELQAPEASHASFSPPHWHAFPPKFQLPLSESPCSVRVVTRIRLGVPKPKLPLSLQLQVQLEVQVRCGCRLGGTRTRSIRIMFGPPLNLLGAPVPVRHGPGDGTVFCSHHH